MLSPGRLLCLLLALVFLYLAKEEKARTTDMFRSVLAPLSRSARTYASQATALAPGAVEGFVGAVGNTPLVSYSVGKEQRGPSCGDFSFWLSPRVMATLSRDGWRYSRDSRLNPLPIRGDPPFAARMASCPSVAEKPHCGPPIKR